MKNSNANAAAQKLDFYYDRKSLIHQPKYSTHCHNAYELIFFLGGTANYLIEGMNYSLKKYDLVITRPSNYHNIDIDAEKKYNRINILVLAAPELTKLLNELPHNLEVVNCADMPIVISCFEKMDLYNKQLPHDDFLIMLNNLLTEVCYNLLIHDSKENTEPKPASQTIIDALKYINENLFTIADVKDVCEHVFVSETHFFRLFKREMRTSPKKYVTTKRLIYAQKLLRSGEKPTEVADLCGFNNYVSFYQRYVDFFGYAPSEELIK